MLYKNWIIGPFSSVFIVFVWKFAFYSNLLFLQLFQLSDMINVIHSVGDPHDKSTYTSFQLSRVIGDTIDWIANEGVLSNLLILTP